VIETGKKHQIRLHCNHALGTPIFGDSKYGFEPERHASTLARQPLSFTRKKGLDFNNRAIMLHAGELEIPIAPGNTELVRFTAKMKSTMEGILDHLHIPKAYYVSN